MEDGGHPSVAPAEPAAQPLTDEQHPDEAHPPPPAPPDPNIDDEKAASTVGTPTCEKSDTPLTLEGGTWNIWSISGLGALRMLIDAVEKLADNMGDVPPTPPVSRPTTPKRSQPFASMTHLMAPPPRIHRRTSSSSTIPRVTASNENLPSIEIGSPEAHPAEPLTIDTTQSAPDLTMQHAAIARRFFSKVAPPFSLSSYLHQLHKHCPHSPAVYLAAATYLQRLCLAERAVPATARTVHRLCLAALRVAAKALEDNKWTQDRMAKVGGVSLTQLMNLEITFCYLLDFDLFVNGDTLARGMFLLQQGARRGLSGVGPASFWRANEPIQLKLPPGRIRNPG